jgi:hypothetical protein
VQGEAREWRTPRANGNANPLLGLRDRDNGSVPAHAGASGAVPVVFPEGAVRAAGNDHTVTGIDDAACGTGSCGNLRASGSGCRKPGGHSRASGLAGSSFKSKTITISRQSAAAGDCGHRRGAAVSGIVDEGLAPSLGTSALQDVDWLSKVRGPDAACQGWMTALEGQIHFPGHAAIAEVPGWGGAQF